MAVDLGNWFVGLPIPTDGPEWFDTIARGHPPEVRLFHPDDLHITLAFLGRMALARRAAVCRAMDMVDASRLRVTFGRVLTLPSPRRITALSLELDKGRAAAAELIGRWRDGLYRAAQARPDRRPPLPHTTIARPKRGAGQAGQRSAIEWARSVVAPSREFLLDRISLYCWASDRRERQFQIVYEKCLD